MKILAFKVFLVGCGLIIAGQSSTKAYASYNMPADSVIYSNSRKDDDFVWHERILNIRIPASAKILDVQPDSYLRWLNQQQCSRNCHPFAVLSFGEQAHSGQVVLLSVIQGVTPSEALREFQEVSGRVLGSVIQTREY